MKSRKAVSTQYALQAHCLGTSLLTAGIFFLLSVVWLEAVNVMQHCADLREMSGVKPAEFYSKV